MRSTCQNKPGQYLIWFGCYYIHRHYWTLFLSFSFVLSTVCVSVFVFIVLLFFDFSLFFLLSFIVFHYYSFINWNSAQCRTQIVILDRFALNVLSDFSLFFILNAVVASRDTSILHFNIGRWMSEFAFSIRSWALISLEFTTHFQLQPTRIFTIQ